jgi:hypothetical protein
MPRTLRQTVDLPGDDVSTDDDYSGLDLISDSGDEGPDMEVIEEAAIIASAEDDGELSHSDESACDSLEDEWAGFSKDPTPSVQEEQFFKDATRMPTASSVLDEARGSTDASNSDDEHNSLFPDIFLPQNEMDPRFRELVEKDIDQDFPDHSDDGSFWDFRGDDDEIGRCEDEDNSEWSSESRRAVDAWIRLTRQAT